jgi:hypothetical protein
VPAKRALRTLATCLDVAVFLWRRYVSLPESSPPAAGPDGAVPLEQKSVVVVEHVGGEGVTAQPAQTVGFGLDGQRYEIDLSGESAAELREAFARYIAAGRRVGRQTRTASNARPRERTAQRPTADRGDSATIREWARANGHQISERGPIPAKVLQAYAGA